MNKLKKGFQIILMLMMIFTQSGIVNAVGNQSVKVSGDDPGVTIKATDPIESRCQVELDVTVSSSAGKLDEDGSVNVTIPKSIVEDPSQLADDIVIGDPFYLGSPAYTDDGKGNYVLNVKYDHTKIDQTSAVGYTFKVMFKAPYFIDNSTIPESVDFNTQLNVGNNQVSTDQTTSQTKLSQTGQPAFIKYTNLPFKTIDGQKTFLLDTTAGTKENTFILIVNYDRQSYDDVTITDQLPADTTMADGNSMLTGMTSGDATPYQHINLYKVDKWSAAGTPEHFTYVTSQLTNDITTTTDSLAIHLGKLTSDDAYVITYGLNVDPNMTAETFGTRYNDAQELNNNSVINQSKIPVAINENQYQAVTLNKSVDHKTLATKNGAITYSLDLASLNDKVKAGTVITDPLPAYTTFDQTVSYDADYVSAVKYDQTSNTISYTLLKDLEMGKKTTIKFKVNYSNPDAQPGEKIVNKASIDYAGSEIYSNDATTTLNGSAYLYKTDKETKNPLAGATFKIVDASGKVVADQLTSDADGFINSGLLEVGEYSFIETKAPAGYELDATPIPFKVTEGQETPVNLAAINRLTPGDVLLTKQDDQSGDVLQGAVFELKDADGKVIQSGLTTDKQGQLNVTDLAPGDYTFVETKAPTGYELETTPIAFTIKKGQTSSVKVVKTNQLSPGDVILTKKDHQSDVTLQGAVFELKDSAGKVIKTGLTTDASGQVAVTDLAPGDYTFVETKAPTGYQLDKTPVKFTITKGQTTAVKVVKTDKLIPGSVILTKQDHKDGSTLQGAVFELKDSAGKVLQTGLTTDASGQIVVKDLAPGDYTFVETKAPTGYDLDQTPVKFTIVKSQSSAVKVTKMDQLTPGSVILTKQDNKDGSTLQGAVFELKDSAGKVLQTGLTTDASGQIAVNDLEPGDYTFVETKAPTGYDLDRTPVDFTITKDQTSAIKVVKTDQLTPGSVILTKQDHKDASALQGAVFELKDSNGKVLQTGLTTDASGQIAINDLEPGDYTFVETKAPMGYDLDKTPVEFTIVKNQGSAVKVTKTDQLTPGSVLLTKQDNKEGSTLQGAVFELKDSAGKVLQTGLTTDASGQIAVKDLEPGDYTFVETKAPTGYDLDKTPVEFTITKNQGSAVKVTKADQLTPGSVILTKKDDQSGEILQGAVFELKDSNGKVLQSGLTTDASGQIAVKDLTPGDYTFIETKAPTGYDLDKTPVKVTIVKGQITAIKVVKTDQLTPGSVVLTKQDHKDGSTLQGAVFELKDSAGKVLKSGLTTDVSGQIAVKDLEPGDYTFVETKAPTGYDLDQVPVAFTITKNQGSAVKVIKADRLTPGSVILTKQDNKDGSTLQGAVFELKDSAGKVLQTGLTTDASGQIAVNDLALGDYTFVETKAPTGYDLDKTPVAFTITKGQTSAVKVTKVDQLTPGSVLLTKQDNKNGATLQGAVFELKDSNGKVLQSGLTTDVSGQIAVNDLEPGDYTFVETKAPTGYELDKTPVKFTITKGQTSAVKVTKTDQLIPGSVILTKQDAQTGAALGGATFKIMDNQQKVIKEDLKSNQNGQIVVTDLAPGDYTFVETKAPTGYVLDETPVAFTVKSQKQAVQVTKENQQATHQVRVEKRAQTTNQLLAGAVFKLVDQKGTTIQTNLVTGQDGVVLLKDLPTGQYQLVETKAPKGYQLDPVPLSFEVTQAQNSLTLVKYNTLVAKPKQPTKPTFKLPQTGVAASKWAIILGGLVVILVSIIYWFRSRKKKIG